MAIYPASVAGDRIADHRMAVRYAASWVVEAKDSVGVTRACGGDLLLALSLLLGLFADLLALVMVQLHSGAGRILLRRAAERSRSGIRRRDSSAQ